VSTSKRKWSSRGTGLPLDLVVLNSFLYERLTDKNFHDAIDLWFENEEEFGHISGWNTSRVTNMEEAFYNQISFNEDLSHWNVGNVTKMSFMFLGATEFNSDISGWDVSQVINMNGMFQRASQFNRDLSRWDVSKVTQMRYMFYLATQFSGDLSVGMSARSRI
jgi:surface protein